MNSNVNVGWHRAFLGQSLSLRFLYFSVLVFFIIGGAQASSPVPPNDSAKIIGKPRRIYHAIRLTEEKPVLDGSFRDACWSTGEWAGDFTQWIPNEGAKPSQKTELKILYDNKNIYVAIRAWDNEPEKIIRKAGRRDEFTGDVVGISFDSYHDHRTSFEFDLTAAGQKTDLILTNPSTSDMSWNAVWYGKTGMEDSAWTAEFEIPLSQLRYSSDHTQVWGMHCWRWIDRLQEESDWEPESSTGPGMLYQFGELHGIEGLPASHGIEIMPYTVGKLKTFMREENNPFADKGKSWGGNLGVDAKISLSSNLTANLTVNPDFGQVESDPSVMNLTAFETFYEERRPFFLEGKNIFSFEFDNNSIFYSRRIGHSPSYTPLLSELENISSPDNSTILGAVKVSGKTSDGLSIGLLQSLTANEHATVEYAGRRRDIDVEPLTSYTVARVQQDYGQGNTMVGGILTSTNRFINEPQLNFLNRDAWSGGIDVYHQWNEKEYFVDAKFIGSLIQGSSEAMAGLQNSSARYYHRPDVDYIHFDTARTQLSGYGGKIKVGKGSVGLWRYSTELGWRSPGLDLNDVGFMQLADIITQAASVSYFVNQPVSMFRTYSVGVTQSNSWDFGMRYLSSGGSLNVYLEFLNKWALSSSTSYTSQGLDTRILRGGYAMLVPSIWSESMYARTDPSEIVYFDFNFSASLLGNENGRFYSLQPGISFMPITTLKISMSLNYSSNINELQYIETAEFNGIKKYILGRIDQKTAGGTFRIDYNITPELSIQYYGSPFTSVGKYSEFKTVTNPISSDYSNRFATLTPVNNGTRYGVSEQNNGLLDYTFLNPDFNFSQFRSNFVVRWEYLPGSQVYVVWSQERTSSVMPGTYSLSDALSNLRDVYPGNIFLIKMNYWFSL